MLEPVRGMAAPKNGILYSRQNQLSSSMMTSITIVVFMMRWAEEFTINKNENLIHKMAEQILRAEILPITANTRTYEIGTLIGGKTPTLIKRGSDKIFIYFDDNTVAEYPSAYVALLMQSV